jgi:hypothetical protein
MSKPHTTSRARKRSRRDDDDEESFAGNESGSTAIVPLSDQLMKHVLISPVGPPRTPEEKQAFFEMLVRLKAQRRTHQECADQLGVSVRSISTYLDDPLYHEIQQGLIAHAKDRGHLMISETIGDAIDTLYNLMMGKTKSEFTRYKAAEKLLDVAGFNQPREEGRIDTREGILKFMDEVRQRQQQTIISIQTNVSSPTHPEVSISDEVIVDGSAENRHTEYIPPHLQKYYIPVEPGGRLPGSKTTGPGRKPIVEEEEEEEDEIE